MTTIKWTQCTGGVWCPLNNLNLAGISDARGVYIIWHTGNPSRVVRVGQGNIAERLGEHRRNPEIVAYGDLLVTWASAAAHQLDGIERYLADKLNPLVGDAFPDVTPIAVNSPF